MKTPNVTLAVTDHCALITIDRPATRNAIDRPTIEALGRALDEIEARVARDEVRVVAVTGGGERVFVSGGDLKEMAAIRTEDDAQLMAVSMRTTLDRLASLLVPTVAILNGHAFGGGAEVALACNMRIAAADINIGFTQVALGIMPAWGGVERLVKLVGRARASHMLLTARVMSAREAVNFGLIETVTERAEFENAWKAVLRQIASVPSVPARAITALIDAVTQPTAPLLNDIATREFARSWVAPEHWDAADAQARQRRQRRRAPEEGGANE